MENICNEAFHTLRADRAHVVCEMTVDIKGESGGRVTEIALHGFDVITGADAVHGVGMTKIVYPCVGKANTFHNTLEAVEDCTIGNIASKLIGEHQTAVLPCSACCTFCACSSFITYGAGVRVRLLLFFGGEK